MTTDDSKIPYGAKTLKLAMWPARLEAPWQQRWLVAARSEVQVKANIVTDMKQQPSWLGQHFGGGGVMDDGLEVMPEGASKGTASWWQDTRLVNVAHRLQRIFPLFAWRTRSSSHATTACKSRAHMQLIPPQEVSIRKHVPSADWLTECEQFSGCNFEELESPHLEIWEEITWELRSKTTSTGIMWTSLSSQHSTVFNFKYRRHRPDQKPTLALPH